MNGIWYTIPDLLSARPFVNLYNKDMVKIYSKLPFLVYDHDLTPIRGFCPRATFLSKKFYTFRKLFFHFLQDHILLRSEHLLARSPEFRTIET